MIILAESYIEYYVSEIQDRKILISITCRYLEGSQKCL